VLDGELDEGGKIIHAKLLHQAAAVRFDDLGGKSIISWARSCGWFKMTGRAKRSALLDVYEEWRHRLRSG